MKKARNFGWSRERGGTEKGGVGERGDRGKGCPGKAVQGWEVQGKGGPGRRKGSTDPRRNWPKGAGFGV